MGGGQSLRIFSTPVFHFTAIAMVLTALAAFAVRYNFAVDSKLYRLWMRALAHFGILVGVNRGSAGRPPPIAAKTGASQTTIYSYLTR
jgi:hypothetical protein